MNNIKFLLNGCDIFFYAEAPEDITLKELLVQCDRIKPDYCACGICSSNHTDNDNELLFTYHDVIKTNEHVSCIIKPIIDNCGKDDWTTEQCIKMGI